MINFSKKLILAKTETAYGSDAAPEAVHALRVSDVEISPLAGDTAELNLERDYHGANRQVQVKSHQTLNFSVPLAGSGVAGEVPGWGVLMRACGMAETITENTSVEYTPLTGGEESASLYFYLDNQLHKLIGARGTWQLELAANDFPKLTFNFTGTYADPSEIAAPMGAPEGFATALVASRANTPIVSLHGQDGHGLASFSYDHASEVTHRALVNAAEEVVITGRNPSGSITIDAPSVAVKNYFDTARQGTEGALRIVHGTVAGNIVELDAPAVQVNSPAYSDDSGIAQLQLTLGVLPQNGNDEIRITVS